MPQKLSAMRYIKNNKRRVAVLIVSLMLCFVLLYLTRFVLSSTEETFRSINIDNMKKIQYIFLAGSSLGLDVENYTEAEIMPFYVEKNIELMEKLKNHKGIKAVYYAQVAYMRIAPPVGTMTVEIPLVDKEDIPVFLNHMNAELIEGRLPENSGELVLDEGSMKNNHYILGGYLNEESWGTTFKIVGVIACENYFGCGIPTAENPRSSMITVLSEGIDDISVILAQEGIQVRENHDNVLDLKQGKKFLKEEVVDVIGNSTNAIYMGIMVLLSISLIIVYAMYLRDRRDEWCLYYSIGYSRKTIYFSVLRELLFTFAAAILIGGFIIAGAVFVLDAAMFTPSGLKCKYFQPETMGEILCAYVLIIGILQIPVRYALYKIRTIDSLEDDL